MVMKFLSSKKGLSTVVETLLLVLLGIVLVGIVWTVVTNLIETRLDETESCIDVFEKVTIGDQYTCYNLTTQELHFSVSIADLDVESVLIGISAEGTSKSIEVKATNSSSNLLRPFNGAYGDNFALPEKNGGSTYIYNMTRGGFSGRPDSIKIVPVVGGNQCDQSDSLFEIYNC